MKPASPPLTTAGVGPPGSLKRTGITAAVAAMYLVAAYSMYGRLQPLDRAHLPTCACGDIVNQVWFLAFALHMLEHGQYSLWTNLLNYPGGINAADNASFPLLGLAVSPVTAWLGPVAAFALLVRLSFFLSALSCFSVLNRLVRSRIAAAFGGFVYAFSPYMAHQGADHMFLVFAPLPPVLLYLVYRLVVTKPARNGRSTGLWSTGLWLGALISAQYLISNEIAVSFVLVTALTLAWFWARAPYPLRSFGDMALLAGRVVGGMALVALPLLAYPAWNAVAGRQHVVGPTQSVDAPGVDPLTTIFPVDRLVLAGFWRTWRVPPVYLIGDTGYIGIPLLIVLAYIAVRYRKRALVRGATVLAVISWVLALGPRLVLPRHVTGIPLPFAALTHVPILQDLVPSRLTLYTYLAVAVLLSVGFDELLARAESGQFWTAGVAMVALLGSASLLAPVTRYVVAGLGGAQVFSETAVAARIPSGGVVLAYPYPVFPEDQAMLWQALGNMRFSLIGGYVVRPLPNGSGTKVPPLLSPAAVPSFLLDAWPELQVTGTQPASFDSAKSELREFVSRYRISTVVAQVAGRRPSQVIAMVSSVYGRPVRKGDLDFWFNVKGLSRRLDHIERLALAR
ncbi:MAG TPA: hypothetical protein VMF65_08855 [Acidimicrobiales bacterium]|nr:hypothetical protein [Acidimicrobiales bacterium]